MVLACGAGETSISLVFPNEIAQGAVRRLRVEAYSPDTGAAAATDRDCGDFEGLAREGKEPIGTPVKGDYQCLEPCTPGTWIETLSLEKVPTGRQIIYVLGYASAEDDATPVLEGCTDEFDSDGGKDGHVEVEVLLKLVIPDSGRLVKTAGDRQVGRAGEELTVPLQVTVEADSPTGSGGTYEIPGVPITFTSEDPGFELVGEASTFSSAEGLASIGVRLPATPGSGEVVAEAPELEAVVGAERARQVFSVSVTEPVEMTGTDTIDALPGSTIVAVALGRLGGGVSLDLAVLGCTGANPDSCATGYRATPPFGATQLRVVLDVGSSPMPLASPGGLGILPAGLVIADVTAPQGTNEIAFTNSRRIDCQGRPGGCEGAEIVLMTVNGATVDLTGRYTMTGSNAVGMTTFEAGSSPYTHLAIVAQGRSTNDRACERTDRCLPVEFGGCLPSERCECPECSNTLDPGRCVARDKMIDILASEVGASGTETKNLYGCQQPELVCVNSSADNSTCMCRDSERENKCAARDGCNCKVPDRIYVGDVDAPVLPFAVAAGPLRAADDWDMVVPSIGGLELIEARTGQGSFQWKGEPIVNAPIHAAAILDLDYAQEEANNDAHRGDVVWYAREACLIGENFDLSCPAWRELSADKPVRGCLGVYYTDGQDSIFDLRTPHMGGCRRHRLDFAPDGMCVGEFNGDGHVDVALATAERGFVYIFSGDGRGGLLDPPEEIEIPSGGAGGPIACGDVDADGRDDVVVSNRSSGSVHVLRTGSR
jgi:hypothetical protein